MISFTQEEIGALREKVARKPAYLDLLKAKCEPFFEPIEVQKTGLASWSHYYSCPIHSTRLIYDRHKPHEHKCPVDGQIFSGGVYDSAWWCQTTYAQGDAAFDMALTYLLTEDEKYLTPAKTIINEFAKYYAGYEVHGNIPYNHPGKALAQVLSDSTFLNSLIRGYDLISDKFSEEETKQIRKGLLLPAAGHLMQYRTPQIHNHEVAINSSLAIIGLVLGRDDIVDYAVEGKYGLKYQLDNAVLEDGLWFEGSSGYHFFALRWFFLFDSFARHTGYCLSKNPHYSEILQKMILFPRYFMTPSDYFPAINDCHSDNFKGKEWIYEYAYATYKRPEILDLLHRTVDGTPRNSQFSLLFGVEDLPPVEKYQATTHFAKEGSHVSLIYGTEKRFLMMKNMPYGGEHDHYDRMAISLEAFDRPLVADIGTSNYGVPLHYAYYKNTASHNTVCFDGKNMPPVEVKVTDFTENAKDDVRIDANIDFSRDFEMPKSFTIKAWDNEVYENAKMRRVIRWFDKYLVDFYYVEGNEDVEKDYTLHILAEPLLPATEATPLRAEGPQNLIKGKFRNQKNGLYKSTYEKEDYQINIWGDDSNVEIFDGMGPNNPSTFDLAYLIERSTAKKVVFVHVIEMCKQGQSVVDQVAIRKDGERIHVTVTTKDGKENVVEE